MVLSLSPGFVDLVLYGWFVWLAVLGSGGRFGVCCVGGFDDLGFFAVVLAGWMAGLVLLVVLLDLLVQVGRPGQLVVVMVVDVKVVGVGLLLRMVVFVVVSVDFVVVGAVTVVWGEMSCPAGCFFLY